MAKPKCEICKKRVATHRNPATPEDYRITICHKCREGITLTETERLIKESGKQTLYP